MSSAVKQNPILIDPSDDDFGAVLNCAVRYCLGRQTYMPHIVMEYITPLLGVLNDQTLRCFERDLDEKHCPNYGDDYIDKPRWMKFLSDVRAEIQKRKDAGIYYYRKD